MSGCGVTEIPSIVSREFHPPGVGDRAPSARVCCKSRQIKRCCLWFQVGIFLTSPGVYVINYLTYAMRRPPKLPPDAKTQALREAGALHPHPRRRPRRRLSEPSVLRPARPSAGQVRDGAPPPGRWTAGDRGRGALRRQPPDVLPDRGRVRGARHPRVGAQASRAEGGPQMHRRDCRLRRTLARRRRRATRRTADGGRGSAVRHLSSRALARPGGGAAQKKPRP